VGLQMHRLICIGIQGSKCLMMRKARTHNAQKSKMRMGLKRQIIVAKKVTKLVCLSKGRHIIYRKLK